jgi:O-antigen ligase
LSARVLYRQRLNGFALEPSWLAHQLNMLYFPVWLSCTMNRYSFHKFRIWKFSFENILLLGGMVTLFLSLSRVGFAAFFMMLALVAIMLHGRIVDGVQSFLQNKAGLKHKPGRKLLSILLFLCYLIVVFSVFYIYTKVDPRMENLFNFSFAQDNPILRFFNELKFGDRVIYWLTGWNIFNHYPLLGVGLGNAGFYFTKYLPAYGWSLVEVENLLNRTTLLLNIKSIWLRLLAETGIIGFSVFIAWLLSFIPELIDKIRSKKKEMAVLGLMGCFVLAALIFEGFSIDSFAMPYWWISLGLAANKFADAKE